MKTPAAAMATGADSRRVERTRRGDSTPSNATIPTPETCPRFAMCAANICPLDIDWPYRKHIRGERICVYLREAVKVGGLAILAVHIPTELSNEVVSALPRIIDRYADISRRLRRSSETPSKTMKLIGGKQSGRK